MPADLFTTFDRALLLVPHLQVQNANAISSPMTWGFPSITAFVGLMGALERKLGADSGLQFNGVGVVCHRFEAQTHRGYTHSFHLSRNPVRKDGSTAGIVEEGRIHLDISLVFDVSVSSQVADDAARQQLAKTVADLLATMRIAGGSVIAPHSPQSRRALLPQLRLEAEEPEQQRKEFAELSRRLLPGFALVARDDLLQAHQHAQPAPATALDAWLDLSRINIRAVRVPLPLSTVTGFHKIAKRRFDDISSVAVGFALTLDEGIVTKARIGVGGVAATPIRARDTEAALEGRPFTRDVAREAAGVMRREGTPMSDHRASASYRAAMLGTALLKLHAQHGTASTEEVPA